MRTGNPAPCCPPTGQGAGHSSGEAGHSSGGAGHSSGEAGHSSGEAGQLCGKEEPYNEK
jgi:hypothetical protein